MSILYPPRTKEEDQAVMARNKKRWDEARRKLGTRYLFHEANKLKRKING